MHKHLFFWLVVNFKHTGWNIFKASTLIISLIGHRSTYKTLIPLLSHFDLVLWNLKLRMFVIDTWMLIGYLEDGNDTTETNNQIVVFTPPVQDLQF